MRGKRLFIIAALLLVVAVVVARVVMVSRGGTINQSVRGIVAAPTPPGVSPSPSPPPLPPPTAGKVPAKTGTKPSAGRVADRGVLKEILGESGKDSGFANLFGSDSGGLGLTGAGVGGGGSGEGTIGLGSIGTIGHGAGSNAPAGRKTSAAEQREQERIQAAQAQAQARYESARAQADAAQGQSQSAGQSAGSKTTSLEFDADTIEGNLRKPDTAMSTPPSEPVVHAVSLGDPNALPPGVPALAPVERYPNIEAPDTVNAGQEIAVQVSLTSEQISPETKILSGTQSGGKLQLQMAEGERQWTLTVNLTVPGMDITRGGTNTAEISVARDSDSGIAVFYLRAQPLDAAGRRDTRILATLWHEGALLARLSRPLTIVSGAPALVVSSAAKPAAPAPMARTMQATAPMHASAAATPAVQLDPTLVAPDLTIIENRVGNTLRLVFFSASSPPVEADIADPDALHAWINSHFKEMASRGRGIAVEPDPADAAAQLHAQDYLNGFGAELYDKFAPRAFKDLLARMLDADHAGFSTIQIYSDDPSLPWELMRPMVTKTNQRMDFLGASYSIARWPVTRRGMMRPPQSLMVEQSAVIAPSYAGSKSLQAANVELTALKNIRGFTEVSGSYAAVRQLAGHPPQGFVHFAGHGAVLDKDGVPQFAILLQDSEMDPATWQALETAGAATHPLFFFNACDVGESRQFMNDVDGWAPALLDGGASGYIGALWPVSDTTAELFASTFYDAIAKELASDQHASVAGILMRTRGDVFRKTQDPTALAYVFYGDPKLTLVKPKP